MAPRTARRAPSRPYRRQGELQQLMLDAGVELVLRNGFTTTPGVTLSSALEQLAARGDQIAIGSVLGANRVWACQMDFQLDVVIELIRRFGNVAIGAEVLGPAIARVRDTADLRSKASRRQAFRDLLRTVGHDYYTVAAGRPDWAAWLAIRATIPAIPSNSREAAVRDHIAASNQRILKSLIEHAYMPLAETFRLRLRDEYRPDGMLHFAAATMGLTAGLALNSTSPLLVVTRRAVTGPERWHLLAVSLEALIHEFFEAY